MSAVVDGCPVYMANDIVPYGSTQSCYVDSVFSNIINNENASNKFIIYPNPAKEKLFFVNLSEYDAVYIYDMLGVQRKKYSCKLGQNFIDIGDLNPGTYFLELINKNLKIKLKELQHPPRGRHSTMPF